MEIQMKTIAQEILAQDATDKQKLRWAEGNAVSHEHDSDRGSADFHFADGSAIKMRPLSGIFTEKATGAA
jgi:hypothetical protein